MKEIILTGYDEKRFDKIIKSGEGGGCYMCKRNDKGVFLTKENDKESAGVISLELRWFNVVEDKEEFKYPLCNECHKILAAFVRRILFGREFNEPVQKTGNAEW